MELSYTLEKEGTKRSIFTFNIGPDRKTLDLSGFLYYTRPSMAALAWEEKRRYDPEDLENSNITKENVKVPKHVREYIVKKLKGGN